MGSIGLLRSGELPKVFREARGDAQDKPASPLA